jgi:hypothetical protein
VILPYCYPDGALAAKSIAIFLRASTSRLYDGWPLDKRKKRVLDRLIILPGMLINPLWQDSCRHYWEMKSTLF